MIEKKRTRKTKETAGKFENTMRIIVCILFMFFLCAPVVMMLVTGEDKTVLDGEKQYTVPKFSVSDFISADFQSNFELWFSTKYPTRGKLVSTYRQIEYYFSNINFHICPEFVTKEPPKTDDSDEKYFTYSDFNPLYAEINKRLYEREEIENTGYKGSAQVVIGDSGYCYEDGYINELYGFSYKYRNCPDTWIEDRVERLSYIQKELARRGIACTFIISPSKASEYERFIPDWYVVRNIKPVNYTRPVDRLRAALEKTDINYIDSARYFDEIGLDETFPLTGSHWNKLAAYEVVKRLLEMYTEQTGEQCITLTANGVAESKKASLFGNPEDDIFNMAYSGLGTENAIKDEIYYIPVVEVENKDAQKLNIFVQGGSFTLDFKHYLYNYGIVDTFHRFYYNTWQGIYNIDPFKVGDKGWDKILNSTDYVILECNEQYVVQMGTTQPSWGIADKQELIYNENDIYVSLYEYLKKTESTWGDDE